MNAVLTMDLMRMTFLMMFSGWILNTLMERGERERERDLIVLTFYHADTSPGMVPSSPTLLRCRTSWQPKGERWSPSSILTSRETETTTYIRLNGNFAFTFTSPL